MEEIELEFIDLGVAEVFENEDGILLYTPFENFGAIQKNSNIVLPKSFSLVLDLTVKILI